MKIAIVLSAPPMRQVFRGSDQRSVAVVAEKALWPLLEADQLVAVEVQCADEALQSGLSAYFKSVIEEERSFRARFRHLIDNKSSNGAKA